MMNRQLLQIFHLEVEKQCKFAVMAVQDLKNALHANDMDRIWYSLHAFLTAVGNTSKLLVLCVPG
jgi:hypothetical protein